MKTQQQIIDWLNQNCQADVDFNSLFNSDDETVTSFDELRELVEDANLLDVEVIYHANAIQILSKEDPSLHESMELADNLGYSPKQLNSELLASLLMTERNKESFYEIENDFNAFLEEEDEHQ